MQREHKLLITAVIILLFAALLWAGPSAVTDNQETVAISVGQRLKNNQHFEEERNFIRYTLPSGSHSITRAVVEESLSSRFGINTEAIFNANGQRGSQVLNADSQGRIRIPFPANSRRGVNN